MVIVLVIFIIIEVIPISKDKVGLIIGKKGWRITEIKEKSGVKELNIRDDQVHLRGTEEQCSNAKKIIDMILKVLFQNPFSFQSLPPSLPCSLAPLLPPSSIPPSLAPLLPCSLLPPSLPCSLLPPSLPRSLPSLLPSFLPSFLPLSLPSFLSSSTFPINLSS